MLEVLLDPPQILLSYDLGILQCYVGSFPRNCQEVAFPFQLIIGSLRRDHADAQVLRQVADRRKQGALLQGTADDLCLDLVRDLFVNRLIDGIAQNDIQGFTLLTVYVQYIQNILIVNSISARSARSCTLFHWGRFRYTRFMISYTYEAKKTLDDALMQLFAIVTMLRSPEGCPWDREQNYKNVATNLIDETYEYIDAVMSEDSDHMREEIGDVLLNAMMLLEMHEEHQDVNIVEALNDVCAKLIRRHPHVFSEAVANNSSEVLDLWNSIKVNVEGKKSQDEDFFSRVPRSLPKLEEAWEIQKQMRKVGFDWPDIQGVIDKVDEERRELLDAIAHRDEHPDHVEEELGDLLFAVVNLARYLKIHPSVALHRSNRKVRSRFNKLARLGNERGIPLSWEHVDALNALWEEIKDEERG